MNIIQCPNCKHILVRRSSSLQCNNGHSFDIAKEGYTNLILANQKKKINAGDNASMINYREAFLSSGHYDFLIEELQSLLLSEIEVNKNSIHENMALLDLGCGSGYYTRLYLDLYKAIYKVGIDISKAAVSKAAKKDKKATYLVASIFNIPLVDNSVDIITNIFAPCDLPEMTRVLKVDGLYLKVIPYKNHMREVAELVYDKFTPHTSDIVSQIEGINNLSIIKSKNILLQKTLDVTDLRNLISMTPYIYRFEEEQLDNLKKMTVTLSFKIIIAKVNQ